MPAIDLPSASANHDPARSARPERYARRGRVTLYGDYLRNADTKCRAANRRDWAEKVTLAQSYDGSGCYYDSPGL